MKFKPDLIEERFACANELCQWHCKIRFEPASNCWRFVGGFQAHLSKAQLQCVSLDNGYCRACSNIVKPKQK